ncbi:hypothetical protein H696_02310 [Fonticula alba]|uniref:Uncharacterized protein n=1 Tax=Fonticula alba TaxID=691883 RepID=A0A058ZBR0_FONAL|nr:hypothetical protein H696_02310 [Fonticula alba]KCV71358.1 hypothetical protein H696_02310 [Fonticula alba]|eukprot:XP_009494481.1 hypothetical protein H696_02310 [Fonticula alba]
MDDWDNDDFEVKLNDAAPAFDDQRELEEAAEQRRLEEEQKAKLEAEAAAARAAARAAKANKQTASAPAPAAERRAAQVQEQIDADWNAASDLFGDMKTTISDRTKAGMEELASNIDRQIAPIKKLRFMYPEFLERLFRKTASEASEHDLRQLSSMLARMANQKKVDVRAKTAAPKAATAASKLPDVARQDDRIGSQLMDYYGGEEDAFDSHDDEDEAGDDYDFM